MLPRISGNLVNFNSFMLINKYAKIYLENKKLTTI